MSVRQLESSPMAISRGRVLGLVTNYVEILQYSTFTFPHLIFWWKIRRQI